jgi:hypothetical protein
MATQITEYFLYRKRYMLGYVLIALLIAGILTLAWLFVPGGLSQPEMDAAVTSSSLTFSTQVFEPGSIINLPYYLLQHLSVMVFGFTTLAIKLPSFILALFSSLGILLLLRMWFKQNVAVLTTILIITTGQFMFLAQNGTPAIVYVFWPIWLLVSALMVSRHARFSVFWKVSLFAIAALSLYTPFTIYILLALVSAAVLHPHLRYIIRNLSKVRLSLAVLCALVLVAPLNYAIIFHPHIGLELLGVPDTWPNLGANALRLIQQYFDFSSPATGIMMKPVYGLGSMILIVLGFVRLFTTKYTARSYIIIAWIVLLIPVLLINPTFISVTFVPGVLLMAMGVSFLLSRWYSIFPRNPYARIAGLIPLTVLLGGLMFSGVDRYIYGYMYDPKVSVNFSKDLDFINAQLADTSRGSTTIRATNQEAPFYQVVAKYHENTSVATPEELVLGVQTTIVTHNANPLYPPIEPTRIITSPISSDADRFYIYKTNPE